jgi:hypothetical protein
LKCGDIKGEIESTIVLALDQALSINFFERKILKVKVENKCRLCKEYEEIVGHLTSGCLMLAKN